MAEHLLRDVHPGDLTTADGRLLATGARVFVTTKRVLVYQATDDGRTRLASTQLLADPLPAPIRSPRRESIELTTIDGDTLWLNRGHGCGCNSPLKVMVPPAEWF